MYYSKRLYESLFLNSWYVTSDFQFKLLANGRHRAILQRIFFSSHSCYFVYIIHCVDKHKSKEFEG